jgi:hypothetical protein
MSSVPTIDDTLSGFPNELPKITELPDYDTLKNLHNLLKENATSVSSLHGDGNNGHLGLVISDAIYAHIAPGTPWTIPACPTALPNILNGATGPHISKTVRQHSEDLRAYNNVESALKKQLITAIPPTYLRAIADSPIAPYVKSLPIFSRSTVTSTPTTYAKTTPDSPPNGTPMFPPKI